MTRLAEYRAFLEAKRPRAKVYGEPVAADAVHPRAKDFQAAVIRWAVQGGRRALFERFGLGKTLQQLEIMRIVCTTHDLLGLIVAPLGVRQEFIGEAEALGIPIQFVRTSHEITASLATIGDGRRPLYLTNYESVREGKIDVTWFGAVSLDEAAILRGFGGTKTFREFMKLFEATPYRFVATATPSPNEYIEILSYAAFLGIMDVGEAKTRFFKRNSEKADVLTLHPHKVEEFWLWVNSWAVFLQKPSDIGFSDEAYTLPELRIHWHPVRTEETDAGEERDGQGKLLRTEVLGVTGAARVKRSTLMDRVNEAVEIVRSKSVHAPLVSGEQGEASGAGPRLVSAEQGAAEGYSAGVAGGQPRAVSRVAAGALAKEPGGDPPAERALVPGESRARGGDVADGEAAEVRDDAAAVRGDDEGAGWALPGVHGSDDSARSGSLPHHRAGARAAVPEVQCGAGDLPGQPGSVEVRGRVSDQIVLWCSLNDEQRALERALEADGITVSSLYGNQHIDERDRLVTEWKEGRTRVFLTKPTMYGAGVNLQQSHTMIFAGIDYKAHDFLQAIHRIHRFQQAHACDVHIVHADAEAEVVRELQAKWARYDEQMARMSALLREYGLTSIEAHETLVRSIGVERQEASGRGWTVVLNDTVEETMAMADNAVDGMILTSIPFGTQYEYTPSYNDFGHTDDDAHFWAQMDFLTPELARVLAPGRVMAIHVKDRIRPGGMDGLGFQTSSMFHADAMLHFGRRHGIAYLGMITIPTDVVRENNQTYRLGYTEQCKDGSRMGVGMPEYVLLFRKPPSDRSNGYADTRVVKAKDEYSIARWQIDAHALWKSNGNRLLDPLEFVGLPAEQVFKRFRGWSYTVYDYAQHVDLGEALAEARRLPSSFMLLQPASSDPMVWTDVARMRTLNGSQAAKGREGHLCPLQFDIVDRLIQRYTNPGELVFDPFGGLMTVPLRAVALDRRGRGHELNARYWADGVQYLRAQDEKRSVPTLFDLLESEELVPCE